MKFKYIETQIKSEKQFSNIIKSSVFPWKDDNNKKKSSQVNLVFPQGKSKSFFVSTTQTIEFLKLIQDWLEDLMQHIRKYAAVILRIEDYF